MLIHRVDVDDVHNDDNKKHQVDFDNIEETNLANTNAFQSSLWEVDALQNHHLYQAASLATALTQSLSTTVGPEAGTSFIHVEDHLDISYVDLIEKELATSKAKKKFISLSYKPPKTLFEADSIISKCFQIG